MKIKTPLIIIVIVIIIIVIIILMISRIFEKQRMNSKQSVKQICDKAKKFSAINFSKTLAASWQFELNA